ncbi:MAG TPA: hypothetical protein VFS42_05425, partial [Burkholderiaceae bacterium]|nr:hypothetical protein [Burkholderiaceae bacterium]
MAYSLKTSGIATSLVMCVAVDDDGSVREFVSSTINAAKTVQGSGGGAATIGSANWKGTSRNYYETFSNGPYDFYGVKFPAGNRPSHPLNNSVGWTLFEAFAGVSAVQGEGGLISYSSAGDGGLAGSDIDSAGKLSHFMSSTPRGSGTTTLPLNGTTKFAYAIGFDNDTGENFYYGLESGAIASDGSSTAGVGFASSGGEVYGIGGFPGQGNIPAKRFCSLLFSRELTLAEIQSLHNDWFGTLFDATPPPTKYWKVPSNATVGTNARVMVMAAG